MPYHATHLGQALSEANLSAPRRIVPTITETRRDNTVTDDPLLVRAILLTAGADPTKLTQWMDHNLPNDTPEQAAPPEVATPHAA